MPRRHRPHTTRVLLSMIFCAVLPAGAAVAQDERTLCSSIGTDDWKQPGYIDRALQACTREINASKQKGPALADSYRARGYWLHRKGDLNRALRDYATAIKLDPKNAESYDYRADVWLDKGDFDRAIADYSLAISINPDDAPTYYARGRAYEKMGQIDSAKEDYHAALARPVRNRNDEWAHRNARLRLEVFGEK